MEMLEKDDNSTMLAEGTAIVIRDFNFDRREDVAISYIPKEHKNESFYKVYLSSKSTGKFVYNNDFSQLRKYFGTSEIDKKRKVLRFFENTSNSRLVTEEYSIINDRPVKVLSKADDRTENDGKIELKTITKTLINGKWKTTVSYKSWEK